MRLLLCLLPVLSLLACTPDDVADDTGLKSNVDGGSDGSDGSDGTDGGSDGTDGGSDGTDGSDGSDGGGSDDPIVGAWLSEGDNISPIFQDNPFRYVSINAVFNADLSYQVDGLTEGGDAYTFIGTFTADGSTSPRSIVLDQSSPSETVAEGIYAVDGDTLTYEVVVTTPDYGFVAPTPSSGFGSTSGNDISEGDNVQTYIRQ